MPDTKHILLVEDDLSLGFLLLESLESAGYRVKLSRNGIMGWDHFRKGNFDLCILDVMLPDLDGFALAKRIKKRNEKMPFLFLTARTMREDKLHGFALGADDYITKPFDEEELLCRIQVVMRRSASEANVPRRFQIGQYLFDYDRQELCFGKERRRITEKENEVLFLLCLHQNRILKREEAVEKIYGKKDYFLGRSFDVFISRLRKMLSRDPNLSIDNVFKVGFIFNVKE